MSNLIAACEIMLPAAVGSSLETRTSFHRKVFRMCREAVVKTTCSHVFNQTYLKDASFSALLALNMRINLLIYA